MQFTMSGSEVVHYDLPPLLVDTASPTTSGCVHVRHHEIQALRDVETHVLCWLTLATIRLALLPPAPPVGQTSSKMPLELTVVASL